MRMLNGFESLVLSQNGCIRFHVVQHVHSECQCTEVLASSHPNHVMFYSVGSDVAGKVSQVLIEAY